MPKINEVVNRFNRGLISPLALGRIELEQYRWFSETQHNWMPRILGSMMLRVGLGYISTTKSNLKAYHIPFVFSNSDTAILEFTDNSLRVRVSETIITRPSVSSAVTNGNFDSNITNWTDADDAGGTSSWETGGYASLVGSGTAYARLRQQVTVAGGDQNVEHALTVVIKRGEVTLRIGSSAGGEQYLAGTVLTEGTYSFAFTPTGDFHIEISSNTVYESLVDSVNVAGSGAMDLTTVYNDTDLKYLRYTQSGDVVYIACSGYQQYKVQRYGTRSWSIVKYQPNDGPFRNINTTPTLISSSGVNGDVTLTATSPVFKSTHPGSLFKMASVGQLVTSSLTGENQFTSHIKVIGTGTQRTFTIIRSGTWTATLTLQRSVGAPGAWVDVVGKTYTTNGSVDYTDGLSNQEIYYRIGIKTGEYTSGTAVASLSYDSGSITGIARITAYSSSTSVTAHVLQDLGNTSGTADWYEGAWSDRRGYPSAVCLSEGRLFWAGKDKVWGSVSDAFESFDSETEGDSGPISRSIGEGPVDTINWLLPLSRLIVGAEGAEWSVKSTTFDEPLTPTNFTIKSPSTQGSAAVAAFKIDDRGVFVDKSNRHLYQIFYDVNAYDFLSDDMMKMVPDLASDDIVRIAVQRKPDTRIHCVLDDGTVIIYVYDRAENVKCWVTMDTPEASGFVEDAFVMPGSSGEDLVYYVVKRTINGSTVRYLEKWALESECQGGTLNKQADSFLSYDISYTTTDGYNFDGATDYLDANALTGIADGKKGTLALNIRFANAASGTQEIIGTTGAKFRVLRGPTGTLRIIGTDSGGTTVLDITTATAPLAAAGTFKILASWDLTTAGSAKIYINDTAYAPTHSTYTNTDIDYTVAEWSVGANASGSNRISGDIYSVWFNATTNLDFSVEATRRKFIASDGTPVYLGATGNLPTGAAPELFLGNTSSTSFATNAGSTGGNFTVNGTAAGPATALSRYASTNSITGAGVISGLSHLEGEEVVLWADGLDLGTYTVASGSITASQQIVTGAVIGLGYTAQFKSTKLAYAAGMGTALNQRKRLASMGLTLYNTHHLGLQYGEDFTNLDDIPLVIEDEEVTAGTIWSHKDLDMMEINTTWSTDGRLCLQAAAPRPCTLLACTITVQTNDHG